jgi:HSP20 family protein
MLTLGVFAKITLTKETEMAQQLARRNLFDMLDWAPNFLEVDWENPRIRVEEYTDGNKLVVKAEMPGIDPDKDVQISLSDGRLRIEAERREEKENKTRDGFRSEFRYGSFVRDIPMPLGAKRSDVKAIYKDGVLEVHVPLAKEGEAASMIPITRG